MAWISSASVVGELQCRAGDSDRGVHLTCEVAAAPTLSWNPLSRLRKALHPLTGNIETLISRMTVVLVTTVEISIYQQGWLSYIPLVFSMGTGRSPYLQ